MKILDLDNAGIRIKIFLFFGLVLFSISQLLIWVPDFILGEPTLTIPARETGGITISGRVLRKSDVMTVPHRPLPGVLVLAISWENVDQLLDDAGATDPLNANLARLFPFLLPHDAVAAYVKSSATTDGNGAYTVRVSAGEYATCLANIGSQPQPSDAPVRVFGCIKVAVTEGNSVKQDIWWGIGGVTGQ